MWETVSLTLFWTERSSAEQFRKSKMASHKNKQINKLSEWAHESSTTTQSQEAKLAPPPQKKNKQTQNIIISNSKFILLKFV